MDISSVLARHAVERPTAAAVIVAGHTVTYAALERRCQLAAAGLAASGVGRGSIAMMRLPSDLGHLTLLLALARLGVPSIGVDPSLPPAERSRQASAIGATVILAEQAGDALPGLALLQVDGGWWDRAARAPAVAPEPVDPDRPFVFATSSGTTGAPKLICWTHRQMRAQADAADWPMHPTAATRYLAIVGLHFSLGRQCALRTLDAGGTLVLPGPMRSVRQLLPLVRRLAPVATLMTPSHLRELLLNLPPDGGPHLPELDPLLVATAPLFPAEREAVRRRISPHLAMVYGMNELGALSVLTPEADRVRPGTVGRLVDGVEAEIVGDDGAVLPPGGVGELRARRPNAPTTYHDGTTPPTGGYRNGWAYSGDIASIDAERYVRLYGRVDDQINVGGQKVYPAEIEDVLQAHPAVAEAAVVGVPSAIGGQRPVAFVTTVAEIDQSALLAHCRGALGGYKVPAAIHRVDALPKNPMGKILKRVLRDRIGPPAVDAAL